MGKNILIVDEVDDTRTTLDYAVRELEKDVEAARVRMGSKAPQTKFSIFVLHVSFGYLQVVLVLASDHFCSFATLTILSLSTEQG